MVLLLIKARGGMRGAHLITFKNLIESDPIFQASLANKRSAISSRVSHGHQRFRIGAK